MTEKIIGLVSSYVDKDMIVHRIEASITFPKRKIIIAHRVWESEDDAKIQAVAENWHRSDLTSQEREDAIYSLYQRYKSERNVADKLGISPPAVHQYVEAKSFRLRAYPKIIDTAVAIR